MSRFARRTDANHGEIVRALRSVGCFVQSMAPLGRGCPDLLVGVAGKFCCLEIKDGLAPPSERRLTDDERHWHSAAAAHKLPVFVVDSVESAIEAVGLLRKAA